MDPFWLGNVSDFRCLLQYLLKITTIAKTVMQGKLSGEPVVLFASTPNLGDLCSVTVRVVHGTEFSTTQPRILRCRSADLHYYFGININRTTSRIEL